MRIQGAENRNVAIALLRQFHLVALRGVGRQIRLGQCFAMLIPKGLKQTQGAQKSCCAPQADPVDWLCRHD